MPNTPVLEFTGERFTPEAVREIWYEHIHRYAFATNHVAGKRVLDLASGEGYGSALLAQHAASVVGMDISRQAIEHARARYRDCDNLQFDIGSADQIPLDDDEFDVIVSFETVEHLLPQAQMLAEFRRVLKPDGWLLMSSPDRTVYSDELGNDNPHHLKELDRDEFVALLSTQFEQIQLLGQRLGFYSSIWSLTDKAEGARLQVAGNRVEDTELTPPRKAVYLLAFAGAAEASLPCPEQLALLTDRNDSVYAHYYHEIRQNMRAGARIAELEAELARLREDQS